MPGILDTWRDLRNIRMPNVAVVEPQKLALSYSYVGEPQNSPPLSCFPQANSSGILHLPN